MTVTALTFEQVAKLRLIAADDGRARTLGWHYPTAGPLVVRGNGDWVSVLPTGRVQTLARGTEDPVVVAPGGSEQ
jgi:hypothetical protein